MAERSSRPFYGEYAWAFDLLIDRPVGKECAVIAAWLIERGIFPGASLLDAGCGTGRYAGELARRGYAVEGVDRSSELIEAAKQAGRGHGNSVSFRVGDLLALPVARYDGILCRGVLNDFVDDDARVSVFAAFAGALRRAGVLILDVREWEATRERKRREPVFRKRVSTDRGKLTFTSTTELDPEHQQLLVSETHTLVNDAGEQSSDYRFVMRCWTRRELESVFVRSGFGSVAYFGAYDPAVHAGATDRLVAVAQLSEVAGASSIVKSPYAGNR
ncbi:MAG TPA: class I SAM-dependent methyltransferase [Vicinamibacterales bacterium]|nr:class I SAM-dependent methyltransferase [Vicinamibacterales bacterium]